MCTVLLPLGDNQIAVNKYIISYQFTPTALPPRINGTRELNTSL